MLLLRPQSVPLQTLKSDILERAGIQLWIKREDLIHPHISGNKWRKLRYAIEYAHEKGYRQLLTFGGAYSNHIMATAATAQKVGWDSIGIIRGEETLPLNSNLSFAKEAGMKLHYLSRSEYREKDQPHVLQQLRETYPEAYLIPEGGSAPLAIPGCAEAVEDLLPHTFDYLAVACGTGGTTAGLSIGCHQHMPNAQVLSFSALKGGGFLKKDIDALLSESQGELPSKNYQLFTEYHFGGYAKKKPELLQFMKAFELQHHIPLDFVYTGKMFFGLFDLILKGFFPKGSKIAAIHTGGLQNGSVPLQR